MLNICNMEFKSQIATSIEESKRLLELCLKKETADMVWMKELAWDEVAHCTCDAETYMLRPIDYLEGESHRGHIPAWSLHRLMEILYNGDILGYVTLNFYVRDMGAYYEQVIEGIEYLIEIKEFNKDYLEEKK